MSIFPTSKKIIKIFVIHSDSSDDERLRDKFDGFLNSWKLQRPEINIRYQNQILPGSNCKQQIYRHLNKAQIILLLESSDFWNQEDCRNFAQLAMERYNANKSHVIPIKFRPTGLQASPFGIGNLSYLPTNGEPVVNSRYWGRQDYAFNHIVENIEKVVEELEEEQRQIQFLRKQQKAEFLAFLSQFIHNLYRERILRDKKLPTRLFIVMAAMLPVVVYMQNGARSASEQQLKKLLTQGQDEYKEGKYEGSTKTFTQVIKIEPRNIDAYIGRGNAYLELNNNKAALDDYTQVIKIDPKNIYAYIRRGNTRFYIKKYQAAIEDYKQVISLNPNSIDAADAYQNIGQVHFLLGKKQTAINYYQMAATIYKKQGNKDGYKQVIDIIQKIQPSQSGSI